ncbi:hypothetical protein J2T02_005678 [Chitinophaga terrae (ex Kim and Jung 2007)]|uniref:hypothetical protein n=1 Tax=Chitinophaga terrae (ex Kim and Jung 2007) TaxID=408074 RepID=UPI002783B899|nr:hypothetical protein [Chitinophaga terrae (ex Kim and Jung 2007)]MDQ0110525.1 hypothetical protein [Chitinophaga terrae (ex Kim and Jung 2007)]
MKKLLAFTFTLFTLFTLSCKKDNNNDTGNSPKYANWVKLTIDGKEYTSSAGRAFNSPTDQTWIESALEKKDGYSDFYIMIMGPSVDFNLMILGSRGPANGLGVFTISDGSIQERFSGGETYAIKSGQFNVIRAESQLIEGTITLNLSNSNRTKTVSGTFRIGEPNH